MDIMVSILTTAYNHGPYIRQALESFVGQKTTFPFEVIVHDDASTDGTADIIREYAQKYPDIIRPVLQKENQFSKKISPYTYMIPLVRGKYQAICEGDDYWCDDHKLQKQVDYMEAHPECTYCFSNSYDVDVQGNVIGVKEPAAESRVFSSEEMLGADGAFCANATSLYRFKDMKAFDPAVFSVGEVGDVPLRCFLALRGNAYGFADKMACYRRNVPGSWTNRVQRNKDRSHFIKYYKDMASFYRRVDQYAQGQYHHVFQKKINKYDYSLYLETSDWKKLHEAPFYEQFKKIPLKQKSMIYLKSHCSGGVKLYRLFRYGKEGLKKNY